MALALSWASCHVNQHPASLTCNCTHLHGAGCILDCIQVDQPVRQPPPGKVLGRVEGWVGGPSALGHHLKLALKDDGEPGVGHLVGAEQLPEGGVLRSHTHQGQAAPGHAGVLGPQHGTCRMAARGGWVAVARAGQQQSIKSGPGWGVGRLAGEGGATARAEQCSRWQGASRAEDRLLGSSYPTSMGGKNKRTNSAHRKSSHPSQNRMAARCRAQAW